MQLVGRRRRDRRTRESDERRDLDRGRTPTPEQRLDEGEHAADVRAAPEPLPPAAFACGFLETRRERTPGAEDQRLDCRLREVELGGDLAIRQPLPLAQE